jgi:hypothetical protein
MVTVSDVNGIGGGGGYAAPFSLGARPPLGQAVGPTKGGSRGARAPSTGPSRPVLAADDHNLRWACDKTPPFSARHVLVPKCDPPVDAIGWKSSFRQDGLQVASHVAVERVGEDDVLACP